MIVGLDTATPATAVALLPAGIERRDDPPAGQRPRHAQRLLVLLHEAMSAAGAAWADVERIAVGVGPGGFTGLRIGIATARALGQAHGIPVAGVSSLAALAHGAAAGRPVLAVLDARRRELFAAAYGPDGGELVAPAVLAPAALGELVRSLPASPLAIGDGSVLCRAVLESAGAAVPPDDDAVHRVSALAVCELGSRVPAAPTVLPQYLRRPDAKPRQP